MPKKKRTVEPADLFRLKFITSAQLSPDGARAAYTVTHVDADKGKEYSAIWVVTLATGEARQFTAGSAVDADPQWSPDGQQIAFMSTRGEKPQLYVIPVDGGEARAITSLKQGVGGGPRWSPDGKQIAFTGLAQTEPRDPTKPYRVDRHVYRFDGMEYLDDSAQSVYVVDANGGEAKRLTNDRMHNGNLHWSPDGKEILFTASLFPDTHDSLSSSLCIVNVKSGEIRTLIEHWMMGSIGWTPDGKRVVFNAVKPGQKSGSKSDLWVISRKGGEPECRSAGLAVGVDGGLQPDMPTPLMSFSIPVSADGKCAYVRVQEGGTVGIYEIALGGKESYRPLVTGERTAGLMDASSGKFLYLVSDFNHPVDLYVCNLDGSDERQLTHLNDAWLAQVKLPTIEHLLFPGSDGTQVEGWILLPPEGKAPYPTTLNIHGGPHSAFGHAFHFDSQMLCGAGFAVLMVNHRASTGYGDAFSTAIVGDWGNLDYHDLMAGVDEAVAKGYADPDRLGIFGISGGGNLSCWTIGQTRRFKAAVPENPVTNWVSMYGVSDISAWYVAEEFGGAPNEVPEVYERCSPITYAHTCTTPTLLIQGEHDYRCPAEQSEQFYTRLKANGCVVEMLRMPNSSHVGAIMGDPAVRKAQNEATLDWMNRYVLGKSS